METVYSKAKTGRESQGTAAVKESQLPSSLRDFGDNTQQAHDRE
jgi:hypothetical protein